MKYVNAGVNVDFCLNNCISWLKKGRNGRRLFKISPVDINEKETGRDRPPN